MTHRCTIKEKRLKLCVEKEQRKVRTINKYQICFLFKQELKLEVTKLIIKKEIKKINKKIIPRVTIYFLT